jgi:hypothetical protein
MSRPRRNPDERGIDWDRDDNVMRDITPGPIAFYVNVDRQVTIVQGNDTICVGISDFSKFVRHLRYLAFKEGCHYGFEFPELSPPSGGKPKAQILRLTKEDESEPPAS